MEALIWVALGGAFGAVARYYFYKFLPKPLDFPLATFTVNAIASFVLGFVLGLFEYQRGLPDQFKLAVATGFCGALSTFSTFVADDYFLLMDGNWLMAAIYTAVSIVVGIALVKAGDQFAYLLLNGRGGMP
ncbi:chromosome condensation protein CcrB [Ignicoccus islandicus DSM 13165]|uniref:Fluoride-specific ion channel FluC n=1 Tax=Ignicoccus islandicus DSM 13165 TaxID=940295 RepID=A0A0U3FIX7_9CREN|nr:fluoride efflux transporter CrcB [Ignicoccus islandicus]ALU11846.1 chromosome condensation protein CcrB [Ignicoccus islandicus DSM 13165]